MNRDQGVARSGSSRNRSNQAGKEIVVSVVHKASLLASTALVEGNKENQEQDTKPGELKEGRCPDSLVWEKKGLETRSEPKSLYDT